MYILLFLKGFCEELCSRMARLWWSRYEKDFSVHERSWKLLTNSKKEGSLGFKEFYCMNLAFLAKQAWRILNNPNATWVRFLKSIYFPNDDFLHVRKKSGGSWIWTNILKGREIITKEGRWMVGGGWWEENSSVEGYLVGQNHLLGA